MFSYYHPHHTLDLLSHLKMREQENKMFLREHKDKSPQNLHIKETKANPIYLTQELSNHTFKSVHSLASEFDHSLRILG